MNIFHKITRRALRANRTRTIVTVIGIVLSMTLFTAVLEGAWSGLVFLRNATIAEEGAYHGVVRDVTEKEAEKIRNISDVKDVEEFREVGFASIPTQREDNPYLYILSLEDHAEDLLPVHLTSGHMPANDRELVVSENLSSDGGVKYRIGEKVNLTVGRRALDGKALNNNDEIEEGEALSDTSDRTYTIVGICRRVTSDLVPYSIPGYIAFTKNDPGNGLARAAFTVKNPYRFEHIIHQNEALLGTCMPHTFLLGTYAIFQMSDIRLVAYGFIAILLVMIMFGSISLIHNSFAISVSERTRQYGMLRSIGATKKQIRGSVYYEAFLLSVIGIPIGLIIGCVGIGITMYALRDAFASLLTSNTKVVIYLVLNPWILLMAVLICLLTTLFAAIRPANRAVRISPMEAIRQSNDISTKKIRMKAGTKAWKNGRLYAALASRNYARNPKRSRSVTFSVFASVILLTSAAAFTSYLRTEVDHSLSQISQADIVVSAYGLTPAEGEKMYQKMAEDPEVKKSTMTMDFDSSLVFTADDSVFSNFYIAHKDSYIQPGALVKGMYFMGSLRFLDDASFRKLCQENGLDASKYMNPENPQGLLYNQVEAMISDDKGRFIVGPAVRDSAFPFQAHVTNYSGEDAGKFMEDQDLSVLSTDITIGAPLKAKPWFDSYADGCVYFPMSAMNTIYGTGSSSSKTDQIHLNFSTRDNAAFKETADAIFQDAGCEGRVFDAAESARQQKMPMLSVDVFVYGFIILISLISAANVLNVIYTGVTLRKREFAILRSIGMTRKDVRHMLDRECLQYIVRALVWAVPVSCAVSFVIWFVVGNNMEVPFFVPWGALIGVSIAAVLVVYLSMRLAEKKISRENLTEMLRNENI